MRDADLLGITQQSDTALVNFSSNLLQLTAGMDETQKQLMVYGMVNTLTALPGIKRVRFYIDNEQTSVFSTKIDLAGEFLRNEGIIRPE
jgi:spore germination protein GerM